MSESNAHKKAKEKAAGKSGQTEVPIKGNRRIDAATKNRATEIERSGNPKLISKAGNRLMDSGKNQKIIKVPQKDINKAKTSLKDSGFKGTLSNIGGTKKVSITKKK